jgi:hypothetical protein
MDYRGYGSSDHQSFSKGFSWYISHKVINFPYWQIPHLESDSLMKLILFFILCIKLVLTQPTLPPHYISTIEVSQAGRPDRYRGVFVFDSTAKRWRLDVVYTFNSNMTLIYVDSWVTIVTIWLILSVEVMKSLRIERFLVKNFPQVIWVFWSEKMQRLLEMEIIEGDHVRIGDKQGCLEVGVWGWHFVL